MSDGGGKPGWSQGKKEKSYCLVFYVFLGAPWKVPSLSKSYKKVSSCRTHIVIVRHVTYFVPAFCCCFAFIICNVLFVVPSQRKSSLKFRVEQPHQRASVLMGPSVTSTGMDPTTGSHSLITSCLLCWLSSSVSPWKGGPSSFIMWVLNWCLLWVLTSALLIWYISESPRIWVGWNYCCQLYINILTIK